MRADLVIVFGLVTATATCLYFISVREQTHLLLSRDMKNLFKRVTFGLINKVFFLVLFVTQCQWCKGESTYNCSSISSVRDLEGQGLGLPQQLYVWLDSPIFQFFNKFFSGEIGKVGFITSVPIAIATAFLWSKIFLLLFHVFWVKKEYKEYDGGGQPYSQPSYNGYGRKSRHTYYNVNNVENKVLNALENIEKSNGYD